ncbi:hypothetical protein M413DRAFT_12190 [Hebeloma cylindrosporum]|uniref:Uncharacterized protein n=1 Tax=Hebeloma cylindrosporum TaxID=76867 RepID=A0A0C3C609_HEBCY|nr:hypothetical protein M413DRAFT_12190 [Hebeloma cylindrosporum h7]
MAWGAYQGLMDLERLIFELAASENGAKASTSLLLVAKRVREWIRPVIFRVINQLGPDSPDFTLFPELLHSVGLLVQHLTCVTYQSINGSSVDISRKITLSSFPNVRDLTIHIPLYLAWGEMDLSAPHSAEDASRYPPACAISVMLKLFRMDDIRLALITQSAFAHYRSMDWEKGANGGVDVWIFAELVVLARRRGYLWTSLPKTITRSVFKWENYLNDDGQKWFSELKLNHS